MNCKDGIFYDKKNYLLLIGPFDLINDKSEVMTEFTLLFF